jgi:amidase
VATENLWGGAVDPEVVAAVEQAAAVCEDLGHHVEFARPKFDVEAHVRATRDIWAVATVAAVDAAARATGRDASPENLEGPTRSLIDYGRTLDERAIGDAVRVVGSVADDVGRLFSGYDAFVTATMPVLPLPLGVYDPEAEWGPDHYYFESALGNLESTTDIFNATGQPAISLPLFQSHDGLPIGIHIATRCGDEATLLQLAASLEEALPWAGRRPSVHAAA